MDDYGLLEAIRLSDLSLIKTIFQRKTKDRLQIQQLILSTLQRTTGGNRDVPLLLSATIDDTSVIAYFVSEYEIDLNKPVEIDSSFREYTFPIISAIRSENLLALDWILKNGGSAEVVDGKGWTPLHHAVSGLNYSVVMRLLQNSIKNIDQENSDGQTALHMATKSGHLEIVKLLINVGRASVGCSRSIDGMAPVHVAAKEGNHHLVLLFCESYNVSAKSQYKCKSSDGKFYTLKSPIHIAASEGNASTVDVLLKYCEANALDSVGNTPLHCCFLHKYDPLTMKPLEQFEDTIKILLLHGCQVTAVNSKNQLASDLAEENGYEQLIGVLNLPKKKLSMRGSKKEKQVERPPSAVLVGSGSLGYQNAESAVNQTEDVENKPTVKKIKSKSGSKRLNVSHHNGDANQSPKPKPLIRKSLSNEILSPENADSDINEKVPEKVGKPKKVEQLTKQKDNNSDPELTTWLKEQAQLLKDKDNNDKTVPMAQSTPPPSKKLEKPTSPTKSPRPIMTNSMNIQKVKDRPLPPPKPFKKPVLPKLDTNKITEPDKDQSFDSMEPMRPVPRPRKNPKTSADENKSLEKEAAEKITSKPKSKTLHKTPHVEDTDGDENRSNTIGKKAVLPKATTTPTISEKSNGFQKEIKKSPPTKAPSTNTREETKRSPIKNKGSVKPPPLVPPSPESSEVDSDEDEDDEDDGNRYTDRNKFLNNKNAAQSFQHKMNDDVSYEDDEEEEEDDEESSDDENNMQHNQAELLSVPYDIPTKTFSRTRSIEVSRNSDKKLGFSIVGGNHDGIFIHTVSKNSSGNIKPGDQIVEVNGRSISGKTKEDMYKLFETLVQNSERVALVLTDEGAELYREIVKNGGAGGDRFYVRAKFSYESGKKRELKIREGEIFCVTDSLPDKYDGLWKAQRMSTTIRKNDDIGVGFIPNRQKADQVALKQHLSNSSNSRNGAFLRSFRRAKSAEKLSNKGGRLNESADAFNSSLTIVGYERVLQAPAPLKKRPVIILGLFCDVVLGMLTQDSPALFFTPPPSAQLEIQNAEFDDAPVDYQLMQKLMSLSENNNNRHLLTIMSPAAIDFLVKKTTLDPIVIFISPVSKSVVKAVKAKLAPHYDKNPGHLYEEAAKFEKNYSHLFSSVVSYTADNWWFFHLKEAITHNQQQNIWVPEELALIAQKKKQQIQHQQRQPMNSLHSSHTNLNPKKMMSQTFDNLQNLPDMKNIELAKSKLKHHATSNGPASLPPKGKMLQQQHSNPAPAARKSETKVNSSAAPVKSDQKEIKQQTSRLNRNFDNKPKPSEKKSDSESDDDDDEEDSENDEEEDDEEESEEEEEEEEKPKQKQQIINTSKAKSIKEVPKLESCPQAFGRDKRAASEKTPENSSQRLVLDAPPTQNNKKPKNLFVRPNQMTSNVTNNSTGSGFADASYDSDASLDAVVATNSVAPVADVKNKKLMFQRATSSQASKETPL